MPSWTACWHHQVNTNLIPGSGKMSVSCHKIRGKWMCGMTTRPDIVLRLPNAASETASGDRYQCGAAAIGMLGSPQRATRAASLCGYQPKMSDTIPLYQSSDSL
jgi:hypothetical protein